MMAGSTRLRVCAWLATALAASASAQSESARVALRDLPRWTGDTLQVSYDEIEMALASAWWRERRLRFRWVRRFPEGDVGRDVQLLDVDFWPTEVAAFGVDRFCVAGYTDAKETIVEIWELDTGKPLKAAPSHAASGERALPHTHIPVRSRSRVFVEVDPERGPVRFMTRNLGRESHVLVLYERSRELVELDLRPTDAEPPPEPRVLCSARGPSGEVVAELDWNLDELFVANHADLGYVYVFMRRGWGDEPWFLRLRDADRDGVLDPGSARTFGDDAWAELSDVAKLRAVSQSGELGDW